MKAMDVPPNDITFLHMFNACAKRSKQAGPYAHSPTIRP
jgi:hypothetical protein